MKVAGKTLRRRLLTALTVFLVLVAYDYATGPPIDWLINLLVPPLYLLASLLIDLGIERWLGDRE